MSQEINPVEFGIEPVKAKEMLSGLSVIMEEREALKLSYIDVIKLPITEENVSIFKDLRIKVRDNRTKGIEPWHKTNKAFYLAGGRFVDAIKNKEVLENEQMEEKLLEGEKFFENQEKQRKIELNNKRIEIIRPYVDDVVGLDFDAMTDEDFDDYVLGKKTRFENEAKAKKEAEELAEKERLAEIEKQKAIEVENAKLKKEAEEKAVLRNERSKLLQPYIVFIRDYNGLIDKEEIEFQKELSEIKIGAEQQWQFELDERNKKARQLFEEQEQQRKDFEKATEIRLKEEAVKKAKDAEIKAEAIKKAEADKLAKAGIKVQLDTWIETFNIEIPVHLKDDVIANDILSKFWQFKSWAKKQSE